MSAVPRPEDGYAPPRVADVLLLRLTLAYLAGVPLVTSLNGLSLWQLGISAIGPLYHTVFTISIVTLAMLRRDLRRVTPAFLLGAVPLVLIVPLQLVVGYSDLSDVGQLYKYALPVTLFGAFSSWRFLGDPRAGEKLFQVMRMIPIVYALLISLSAVAYWTTGFEASAFPDGLRFTGFIFAYNGTVNSLLVCGYATFVVFRPSIPRATLLLAGFYLLKSKSILIYVGLAGWWVLKTSLHSLGRQTSRGVSALIIGPIAVLVVSIGISQTLAAADVLLQTSAQGRYLTTDELYEVFIGGRLVWWEFMIADVPDWNIGNLLIGNGFNVIRQGQSDAWILGPAAARFPDRIYDKSNKALELDGISQLDLFGIIGLIPFVLFFYVWPFTWKGLQGFRLYYALVALLSLLTGQVLNNPQVSTLLVVFLLHVRARAAAAAAATYSRATPMNTTRVAYGHAGEAGWAAPV